MSLLQDSTKHSRMHILETDTFSNTFGSKAQRKKPKLNIGSMEELMSKVDDTHGKSRQRAVIEIEGYSQDTDLATTRYIQV